MFAVPAYPQNQVRFRRSSLCHSVAAPLRRRPATDRAVMDAAVSRGLVSRPTFPATSTGDVNSTASLSCSPSKALVLKSIPLPGGSRCLDASRDLNYRPLHISSTKVGHVWKTNQKRNFVVKAHSSAVAGECTFIEGSVDASAPAIEEKIGVLLLNLGGPDTLDDVQPFLFNLFADPDIIRLPRLFQFLQRPLAKLISTFRAPKSKEGYAAIGGGSPLRKITDEQAQALKMALVSKGKHVNVYIGMRYWYPFTEEAAHQIKKDRITKLVVLPLYPQFSISTTGSSLRVLQSMFREDAYLSRLPVAVIKSWYQREGYIRSMADLIEKELRTFKHPDEVMIFFSAHGVPVSYVEDAGDPYRDQMEDCISLIVKELKARGVNNNHTLAYQSRVGPAQWLKPYTDEVLVELGQSGVKSLLAIPVSFVSEHIETLEEIDMEYRELALGSGIDNWGRVPALNCTSSFITDLADAVTEALPEAAAMSSTSRAASEEEDIDNDPVKYAVKILFGSVLAFLSLFSPKVISAFKTNFL